MSVIAKGMKMPTSCRDCGIEQEGFWCGALEGYQNTRCFTSERRDDCPLIELPSPHGKLIDVSSLDPYNDMWKRKCIPMEMVYNARAVAYEAPAILESDPKFPKTNADRIRAMSDEELAEHLNYICDHYYAPYNGWLDWLKKEVK